MARTQARADRGESLHPGDVIPCASCGIKLGANAIHNLLGNSTIVVCTSCVHRIPLHRRFYRDCPYEHHDLLDHPVTSTTRASARQIIRDRSKR